MVQQSSRPPALPVVRLKKRDRVMRSLKAKLKGLGQEKEFKYIEKMPVLILNDKFFWVSFLKMFLL
jgi:hypothetical protein